MGIPGPSAQRGLTAFGIRTHGQGSDGESELLRDRNGGFLVRPEEYLLAGVLSRLAAAAVGR